MSFFSYIKSDMKVWGGEGLISFFWRMRMPRFRALVYLRLYHYSNNVFLKKIVRFLSSRLDDKYGINLPVTSNIGEGFLIAHSGPFIIGSTRGIGKQCIIHPGCMISSSRGSGSPVIGDRVFVGNGAKIYGAITIGNDVFIAPNSVVVKDVPSGSVVGGIPAKIINEKGKEYCERYHQRQYIINPSGTKSRL